MKLTSFFAYKHIYECLGDSLVSEFKNVMTRNKALG